MFRLDHVAISTQFLRDGADWVEAILGVPMQAGGQHPAMGTHNRLLGLGPECYLEVIAIDPEATPPGHPRWFDLDRFRGPPRLTNWILSCEDLPSALATAPDGAGRPMALARGDLRWQMAVPADGRLPFGGIFPALIQWQGKGHPAARLPDSGCRLTGLEVIHPDAPALQAALAGLQDPRVSFVQGPVPGLRAHISSPNGKVVLE